MWLQLPPPLVSLLSLLLLFQHVVSIAAAAAGLDPAKAPARRPKEPPCLAKGDEKDINQLFSEGGPGTRVSLCPKSTFKLFGPIFFTSKDQELSTQGYPTDATRAKLVCAGETITAVQGDCRRCARVALLNIQVDGSRPLLGRAKPDDPQGALIALGNNEGQRVEHCKITDPRGWAAVHIREGDDLRCTSARVEWNEIGPAGEEWIEAIDGPDPELSPLGKPLGDGVSLSCRDSVVSNNVFVDTTDAAVVIFGSPGSTISSNSITSQSLTQMGGILLVDYGPFEGAYTDTIVSHNTLDALGALMRVAIGVGPPVWSDDLDTTLRDGTVSNNILRGYWMGYGIVVASVTNFTVLDNLSKARHSGVMGERCPSEPEENAPPQAFLYNSTSALGVYQPEFVNGAVQYAICIDPESESGDVIKPIKPVAAPPLPKVEPEPVLDIPPTVKEPSVIDEIFGHSKQRIFNALKTVHAEVNIIADKKDTWSQAMKVKEIKEIDAGAMMTALSGLSKRVANLETERAQLRHATDGLRAELESLGSHLDNFENHETTMLHEVLRIVSNSPRLPPLPAAAAASDPKTTSRSGRRWSSQRRKTEAATTVGWGELSLLVLLQGMVLAGWWACGRCVKRRKYSKMI